MLLLRFFLLLPFYDYTFSIAVFCRKWFLFYIWVLFTTPNNEKCTNYLYIDLRSDPSADETRPLMKVSTAPSPVCPQVRIQHLPFWNRDSLHFVPEVRTLVMLSLNQSPLIRTTSTGLTTRSSTLPWTIIVIAATPHTSSSLITTRPASIRTPVRWTRLWKVWSARNI